MYKSALKGLSTVLYNFARVYEVEGEDDLAKDAYEKLLSRHPVNECVYGMH